MEDGTVSIFGLVFGVAAAAPDSHAVPGVGEAARQNPFVPSAWMFLTDLFAAAAGLAVGKPISQKSMG